MPRASKACSQPGCPHLQPCPTHPKIAWAGSTRRARLPPGWTRIRAAVLYRDPTCQIRDICNGAPSTDVDHITAGDDHSLTNLQGACGPCHKRKTAAEAAQARRT